MARRDLIHTTGGVGSESVPCGLMPCRDLIHTTCGVGCESVLKELLYILDISQPRGLHVVATFVSYADLISIPVLLYAGVV